MFVAVNSLSPPGFRHAFGIKVIFGSYRNRNQPKVRCLVPPLSIRCGGRADHVRICNRSLVVQRLRLLCITDDDLVVGNRIRVDIEDAVEYLYIVLYGSCRLFHSEGYGRNVPVDGYGKVCSHRRHDEYVL